jgi:hypothetical protein
MCWRVTMTDLNNQKLAAAIYYLVQNLEDRLTRTKLVKLLFLADKDAKETLNKTITGLKYTYYLHGPYNEEITSYIHEMDGCEIKEIPDDYPTYTGYTYKIGDSPRIDPMAILSKEEKCIFDNVIINYGRMSLNDILKLVYSLDCMTSAKPLEIVLE